MKKLNRSESQYKLEQLHLYLDKLTAERERVREINEVVMLNARINAVYDLIEKELGVYVPGFKTEYEYGMDKA